MDALLVAVGAATVIANAAMALADLVRSPFVLDNAARVGVPSTWLPLLAALKAAGAAGLLVGLLIVPPVGIAAAAGLTLFFLGAIATHLRAHDHALLFPGGYLALAVASLILFLAAA